MTSVGDVIAICEVVLRAIDFCKTAHGSAKEKTELCDRLRSLSPILNRVNRAIESAAAELRDTFQSIITQVNSYLQDLEKKLRGKDSKVKNFISQVRWPLERDNVNELFQGINELISQLNLGISIESLVEDQVSARRLLVGKVASELQRKFSRSLSETPQQVQAITQGTCEWFWAEDNVREWLSTENELLCVHGFAGTGKTGLVAHVGDNIVPRHEGTTDLNVARIYCNHEALKVLTDHMDILMSFWVQLVSSNPDINLNPKELNQWYEDLLPSSSLSYDESVNRRIGILTRTIGQAGNTVLILDGFDEVPQNQRARLFKSLKSVQSAAKQCRILVTTRPYSDIMVLLEENMKLQLSATDTDIGLYIEDRMNHSYEQKLKPKIRRAILDELTLKCQGSFQLVKLYMDEVLRATNDRERREVMQNLPDSATDFYDRGLQRLQDATPTLQKKRNLPCQAIQALFWVVFSKAPMTEPELVQALAVMPWDDKYDKEGEPSVSIETMCGGMVIKDYVTGEIRIAHKSIADHLRLDATRQRWFANIEEHIPEVLLIFLSFKSMGKSLKDIASKDKFRKRYPLIPYALRYWGEGLDQVLKEGTDLWRLTEKFLKTSFAKWNEAMAEEVSKLMASKAQGWAMQKDAFMPGTISGMHWVATFGLTAFVQNLMNYEKGSPVRNPVSMTPLGLAAAHNQVRVAEAMLEVGVKVNDVGVQGRPLRPPLYDAVYHRNDEVTSLILINGADMTLRRIDNNESPLDLAYVIGRERLARTLARSISGMFDSRAQEIQFLVRGAFAYELKRVIDEGLDVNHPCENGKLALDYANELGNEEIMDILTTQGAKTNLIWPASTIGSASYPQNLPQRDVPGYSIVSERKWGEESLILRCFESGDDVEFEEEAKADDAEGRYRFSDGSSDSDLGSDSDSDSDSNLDLTSGSDMGSRASTVSSGMMEAFELKRRGTEVEHLLCTVRSSSDDDTDSNASYSAQFDPEKVTEWTEDLEESVGTGSEPPPHFDMAYYEREFGSDPNSYVLLEVPMDDGIKFPIQTIVFETVSNDQGWSSHDNHGTYLGSTRSWFDVRISNPEGDSEALRVQHNVHASLVPRLHTNIWNLKDLEGTSVKKAQLMRSIRRESTLILSAHALGGRGWENHITYARVHVVGAAAKDETEQ